METKTLPLFPLGLVAFPREKLNLHIFEPRYRQLVEECFRDDKTFGIPPFKSDVPMDVGTEMEILEISKIYDDGKMDIRTLGLNVFKVEDFYSKTTGKLYPGGEVTILDNKPDVPSTMIVQEVKEMLGKLYNTLGLQLPFSSWDDGFSIYEIGHKVGLSMEQETALLKLRSEADRMEFVRNHLAEMIPMVEKTERLKHLVQMNGHFKNIIPPEV